MGKATLNPRQHELDVGNIVVVNRGVITDPQNISFFERFLFGRGKRKSPGFQSASNEFIKTGLQNRRPTPLELRDRILLEIETYYFEVFATARGRDAAQMPQPENDHLHRFVSTH